MVVVLLPGPCMCDIYPHMVYRADCHPQSHPVVEVHMLDALRAPPQPPHVLVDVCAPVNLDVAVHAVSASVTRHAAPPPEDLRHRAHRIIFPIRLTIAVGLDADHCSVPTIAMGQISMPTAKQSVSSDAMSYGPCLPVATINSHTTANSAAADLTVVRSGVPAMFMLRLLKSRDAPRLDARWNATASHGRMPAALMYT